MVRDTFDYKEEQLIDYSLSRIMAHAFDEHDILALLILLREHAPENSPVRELGDFTAHRVRDRGPFLEFVRNRRVKLEKLPIIGGQGATNDLLDRVLSAPGVYSQSDVLSSLNGILQPAGFQALPNALASDILVCIMSLLQDIRFVNEQKTEVGKLLFIISKTKVGLLGQIRMPNEDIVMVPMLSTDNHYHPFEPQTPQELGVAPNRAITVVRRAGVLRFEFR
jgi:hypothetical protein